MSDSKTSTVGISPKVAYPFLAGLLLGTVLVVVGVLAGIDVLVKVGIGVLASAGVVVAPVGYHASPGEIVRDLEPQLVGELGTLIQPTPPPPVTVNVHPASGMSVTTSPAGVGNQIQSAGAPPAGATVSPPPPAGTTGP